LPFSGKIFFDNSVNSLILNVSRQKIFSQLLKLFGSGSSGLWTVKKECSLKLWDVQSGNEVRTFEGHREGVTSVCFAPGGKTILSGSSDHTLKLWDVQSGQEVRTFEGHREGVTSVCFAPGGKAILSGSEDHTLKLWDIKTGACIKTISLLWIPLDIKFHPGRPGVFATANGNGTVTFFDIRELLEARRYQGRGIGLSPKSCPLNLLCQGDLADGKHDLADRQDDLIDGKHDLNDGQDNLNDGKHDLNEGQDDLNDQQNDLSEGQDGLSYRQHDLSDRQDDLSDRQYDLSDGASELACPLNLPQ
jgi:hypothetical protein